MVRNHEMDIHVSDDLLAEISQHDHRKEAEISHS